MSQFLGGIGVLRLLQCVCVPIYGDAFCESMIKEENSYTSQLGDCTGFHRL